MKRLLFIDYKFLATLLKVFAVTWLKYCRYGVKQSIIYKEPSLLPMMGYKSKVCLAIMTYEYEDIVLLQL